MILYTAGPYRAPTLRGIKRNIDNAYAVAGELWMMGHPTICPHANTAYMDGEGTDNVFLQGDLRILERCDAIVMLPGYEKSKGATAELNWAVAHGLEVFYWPFDIDLLAVRGNGMEPQSFGAADSPVFSEATGKLPTDWRIYAAFALGIVIGVML